MLTSAKPGNILGEIFKVMQVEIVPGIDAKACLLQALPRQMLLRTAQ